MTVTEFCNKRGMPDTIKEAFTTYCKASIYKLYDIKGNTATGVLNSFNEEDIYRMWINFILDVKKVIDETKVPEVHTPEE